MTQYGKNTGIQDLQIASLLSIPNPFQVTRFINVNMCFQKTEKWFLKYFYQKHDS